MARPSTMTDALVRMHTGQWFTFTDFKNQTYANLRLTEKMGVDGELINNPHSLPTEEEINTKLTELQTAWDLQNDSYKSNRRKEYPSIEDQLDDIYHNGIDGWKSTIKATKDKYPKS